MKLNLRVFLLFLVALTFSVQSLAGWFSNQNGISIVRQNGKTKVNVPTHSDGSAPSVYVRQNGNSMVFATGAAATNLVARPAPAAAPRIDAGSVTTFTELLFISDFQNKRIAAAYPAKPLQDIYVTALHALKDAQLESKARSLKAFGLQNTETNQIYDIALLSEQASLPLLENQIKMLVPTAAENEKEIYSYHLNLIDKQGELTLSKSHSMILTANADYLFFKNNAAAFVGPSSSGAIIYESKTNYPKGIIICSSHLINSEKTPVIRALNFSVIQKSRVIELSADLIQSFKPLGCDLHDARRGGGD